MAIRYLETLPQYRPWTPKPGMDIRPPVEPAKPLFGNPNRSEMMAYILKNGYQPTGQPQSIAEGAVRGLGGAFDGWMAGQVSSEEERKKQERNQALASLLYGEDVPENDPRRLKLAQALDAGLDPSAFGSTLAKNLGLSETETDKPIEVNGRLVRPNTTGGYDTVWEPPVSKADRPMKEDDFGTWRYIDGDQEPVFEQPPNRFPPPQNAGAGMALTAGGDDPVGGRQPLFKGNTLQAQALNGMYLDGLITRDEAMRKAISDEQFRMLTDPEERAARGITPDDRGLYMIDTDNKITAVGGGGTTINNNMGSSGVDYGDPEPGYAWARDASDAVVTQPDPVTGFLRPVQVPIGGGKLEREAAADAGKTVAGAAVQAPYVDAVTDALDKSIAGVEAAASGQSGPVTGIGGVVSGMLPASQASIVREHIKTVLASISFDRLQAMRDASKTGGALGAITERELDLLSATLGSLNADRLDDPNLLDNLRSVQKLYRRIQRNLAIIQRDGPNAQAPPDDVEETVPVQNDDPLGLR